VTNEKLQTQEPKCCLKNLQFQVFWDLKGQIKRDEIENYKHRTEQNAYSKTTRQNHSVIHSTDIDINIKPLYFI